MRTRSYPSAGRTAGRAARSIRRKLERQKARHTRLKYEAITWSVLALCIVGMGVTR
jgi:hypothetical protein